MLGLELFDDGALAIVANDRGEIAQRALVEATDNLAVAADAALVRVGAPSDGSTSLGIAAFHHDSPAVKAAVSALVQRYAGPFVHVGATPSGVAATVAEAWIGAAKHAQDVVFFAADRHTTGGILRNGVAITGAHGRAGSVAWLALNPVERDDYRKTGCLEAETGAAGIVRRLIWRIKSGDRSRIQDLVKDDFASITPELVLKAARDGDGVAFSVMRDTAKYLGMAAANLVLIADPEMLVLGGIIATAPDLLFESVRTEIGRRLPKTMMEALTIVPATLGADAAALGAARLAAPALQ
jgi:predicted NBD/HSP70 family sugar kinase